MNVLGKLKNYFTSLLTGVFFGFPLGGFGFWLYSGSMSGEFSCSVSFLPCPLVGLVLMGAGIIFVILGLLGHLGDIIK
jgi:hypothetical protein